jgi:hypothetical protein
MMLDRKLLLEALAGYRRQEEQALADANTARGAVLAIEHLLKMLDSQPSGRAEDAAPEGAA